MDGKINNLEGAGSHIWLRYATQFQSNGRTHTVEIGIPVPIGASAETRERLIREAEEGLDQLSTHINGRVASIVQRSQVGQKVTAPSGSATTGTVQPVQSVQPTQQQSANKPTPPPQTPKREEAQKQPVQAKDEVSVPAARTHVGTSMPGMLDTSSNLNIPQFLQVIKESLNLDARQAMDLLQVKALSGLNLRDALEQLQQLAQSPKAAAAASQPQNQRSQQESVAPAEKKQPSRPATSPSTQMQETPSSPRANQSSPAANQKKPPFEVITGAVIRDGRSGYTFDEEEEIDLDSLDIPDENEMEYPQELSDSERQIAEDVLSRLREARGSSAASAARLNVLNNVTGGQISAEQLQQIIEGVWSVSTVKKLKNDQVEELIRWAKMDDFEEEVELVLVLLAEEQYARSDR